MLGLWLIDGGVSPWWSRDGGNMVDTLQFS